LHSVLIDADASAARQRTCSPLSYKKKENKGAHGIRHLKGPFLSLLSSEAELAPKREVPPVEATALEALLRGDSLVEKKNNICKEEETLLEIQVVHRVCSMYY